MKQLDPKEFNKEFLSLIGKKEIQDIHYYQSNDNNPASHKKLMTSIKSKHVWSIILVGPERRDKKLKFHKNLHKSFQYFPTFWSQLFFIEGEEDIKIYRGNYSGSGYRLTHGVMANAFALLNRKKKIRTYILSESLRGKLYIWRFDTFKVYGHELFGNYPITQEQVNKNIPKCMRIYGQSSLAKFKLHDLWAKRF